jgi:hypothetical protein
MSRIDNLNDILSIVRRKVEETGRARAGASTQKSGANDGAFGRGVPGRVDARELERRVLERIRQIPADERDFVKKAGRIFVDAVMAWEFGEELLLDAEYDEMAHSVLATMLDHPDSRKVMEQVFRPPTKKPTRR